jgi:hypothetical protein
MAAEGVRVKAKGRKARRLRTLARVRLGHEVGDDIEQLTRGPGWQRNERGEAHGLARRRMDGPAQLRGLRPRGKAADPLGFGRPRELGLRAKNREEIIPISFFLFLISQMHFQMILEIIFFLK